MFRSPPQDTEFGSHGPYDCCAAIRIAGLEFVGVTFIPRGLPMLIAFSEHLQLTVGDFARKRLGGERWSSFDV